MCFHRFNVYFTGVINPSNSSTNTQSAHLTTMNWNDGFDSNFSAYQQQSQLPQSQLPQSQLPTSFSPAEPTV